MLISCVTNNAGFFFPHKEFANARNSAWDCNLRMEDHPRDIAEHPQCTWLVPEVAPSFTRIHTDLLVSAVGWPSFISTPTSSGRSIFIYKYRVRFTLALKRQIDGPDPHMFCTPYLYLILSWDSTFKDYFALKQPTFIIVCFCFHSFCLCLFVLFCSVLFCFVLFHCRGRSIFELPAIRNTPSC